MLEYLFVVAKQVIVFGFICYLTFLVEANLRVCEYMIVNARERRKTRLVCRERSFYLLSVPEELKQIVKLHCPECFLFSFFWFLYPYCLTNGGFSLALSMASLYSGGLAKNQGLVRSTMNNAATYIKNMLLLSIMS